MKKLLVSRTTVIPPEGKPIATFYSPHTAPPTNHLLHATQKNLLSNAKTERIKK